MQSCLSSFFQLKALKNGILSNFFDHFFFDLLSLTILSGLVFLLVEYKIDKMIDEMNIL